MTSFLLESAVGIRTRVAAGDTPRNVPSLHHVPVRGLLEPTAALALPPRCEGRRACSEGRRLRARCEPRLEFRPLAARIAALSRALSPLHGQGRALLVAPV